MTTDDQMKIPYQLRGEPIKFTPPVSENKKGKKMKTNKRKIGTEPQAKKHWTRAELKFLLKHNREGFSYHDIGEHLGRSEKAVQLKVSKLRNSLTTKKKAVRKNKIDVTMHPIPIEIDSTEFILTKRHALMAAIWAVLVGCICFAILAERLIG